MAIRAYREAPVGFSYPDAFHYLEMGRQLSRGEGFTSLQAYPYLLGWLEERGLPLQPPWPNVSRFPLLPIIYSLAFLPGQPQEETAKVIGYAFFVLTAIATFSLGARIFGTAVGFLAALLYLTNLTQIGIAGSGLPETAAGFLLVASALAFVSSVGSGSVEADRRKALSSIWLGVVLGLAFLLRHDLLALAVAAFAALCLGRGATGVRQALWAALGFAIPTAPWILRNLFWFGTPVALLAIERNLFWGNTGRDPYRSFDATPLAERIVERSGDLLAQLPDFLWPLENWQVLFGYSMVWLGPAFLLSGAVLIARRHPALRLWWLVVTAIVLRTLIFTFTHHELRFYHSYVPLLLVFAAGGIAVALPDFSNRLRWIRPALGATAVVASLIAFRAQEQAAAPFRVSKVPATIAALAKLARRTPPGSVVATDRSEQVAWYTNRPALGIEIREMPKVEEMGLEIDALLYRNTDAASVHRVLRKNRQRRDFDLVPTPGYALFVRRAVPPLGHLR